MKRDYKEDSANRIENNEKQQKMQQEAVERSTGIRCYGQAGFFAPVKQEDGSIVMKFFYGRDGD